jgi:hypothetical protein
MSRSELEGSYERGETVMITVFVGGEGLTVDDKVATDLNLSHGQSISTDLMWQVIAASAEVCADAAELQGIDVTELRRKIFAVQRDRS